MTRPVAPVTRSAAPVPGEALAVGTLAVAALALALSAVAPVAGSAQDAVPPPEVRTAVGGDSIRVGDVVPVAVRVVVARGTRVAFPDTLPLGAVEDGENASRVRERVDTLDDGRLAVTGVYAVTPWRPGSLPLPDLPVQVISTDEGARTLTASLPALDVLSVLPEDTAGIEPRPAKGVVGPSWSIWPFLLALLLLLALVAFLIWWFRRRRGGAAAVVEPETSPRERALALLDDARASGLLERGDMKAFYTRLSVAVRGYAAALEPAWGEDLTTSELLARLRSHVGPEAGRDVGAVLRPADQVKFARRRPTAQEAEAEWERARAWVAAFDWPPPAPPREEAA